MIQSRLAEEFAEQGVWLFRWRSYIPLMLLPLAIFAIWTQRKSEWIDQKYELIPEIIFFCVSICGIVVRAVSIGFAQSGTSGRNTKSQVADHINTNGMYSICRHPLYLGNILIALGILLFTQSSFFVLVGMMAYWMFYERITTTEENFIAGKFGKSFEEWAKVTPYMIPALRLWRPPTGNFSMKSALRSELYSLLALASSFVVVDMAENYFRCAEIMPHPVWLFVFAVSLVLFIVGRTLRKHTSLLDPKV